MLHFADRRQHTVVENLRLAAVIPLIFLIIGIFLPFVTATLKMSASSNTREVTILQPENPAVEVSLGDFVTHKPLSQFAIFGHELGDVQFLGLNVYDTLTRPFPTFDKLNQLDQSADGKVAAFLVNENFVKFCQDNLGDTGQSIIKMGQVVNNISEPAREGLHTATTTLNNLNAASTNVRNGISQIEGYLRLAGNILAILCLLLVVVIVLFIIGKGPRYLPAVVLTIFSVIFIAVGVGIAITDVAIANALAATAQNVSESIRALINNVAPGSVDMITNLVQSKNLQFHLNIDIFCNIGWWFVTIALVVLTVLSYVVPALKPKTK